MRLTSIGNEKNARKVENIVTGKSWEKITLDTGKTPLLG
jgi:hypothetical protein